MALDIWFREDITRVLLAAEQASATTAAAVKYTVAVGGATSDSQYLRAYREGYKAALVTVATAFGLTEQEDKVQR